MKGNNDDIRKISNIQDFVKTDYGDKYITGYILGNWKEAENVIQQYSPITNFIVQNEDAKSTSEVLSRIKQYIGQDGIDIQNFMINCLPMEMQSIREVFPDCGLYLCDFHRNQCWGRWFRMTQHGISQH